MYVGPLYIVNVDHNDRIEFLKTLEISLFSLY